MKTKRNIFLLFLCATIWGTAFVAQKVSLDVIHPFAFIALRYIIGFLFLLPFVYFRRNNIKNINKAIQIGAVCGIILFIASSLQQIGMKYTSVGKAGFLTALYIIIVPFLNRFIYKSKINKQIIMGLVLALVGLYLLSFKNVEAIALGDLLEIACAIGFSFHILFIDHYAYEYDGITVSCVQFLVAGLLGTIISLPLRAFELQAIQDGLFPILYTGIFSSGIAYTLQIVGQKDVNPTIASLIMSLESSIALVAGFLILHQTVSLREGIGCLFVFVSIMIAQIPSKKKVEG